MQRTITHRLEFTPEEIRDALMDKLREWDRPYPDEKNGTAEFQLTEDGAIIKWTEIQ